MTITAARPTTKGPLRPIELATGAVMSGVTIALAVLANLVPILSALQVLVPIPMGIIAQRHRIRALVAATAAAMVVAFVAGGFAAMISVASWSVLGGIVGHVKQRRGGLALVFLYSLGAGVVAAAYSIGLLLVLSSSRKLVLDTLRDTVHGFAQAIAHLHFLIPLANVLTRSVDSIVHNWWLFIGGGAFVGTIFSAAVAWFVLGAVLDRLAWLPTEDRLDAPDDNRPTDPLPVRLDAVDYRYPGARSFALTGIDLTVDVGEFVAVVGHNGSGKSTLARILAGKLPTAGRVTRPGSPGLGAFGGTAVVAQRPESQILGVLVADDVVWGLPEGTDVDVDGLLGEVGLDGMGERETISLSGGEQQRLAVAAALARSPRLLIADEATSMVDPAGRHDLVRLLASLPARHPMAVVLITHQESEAVAADRVVHLADGRIVDSLPQWRDPSGPAPAAVPAAATEALLTLTGVRHTYNAGTPWATEALHGIDLTVTRGEGVLIVGGNGSGKSTLAWTMAGLIEPTSGTCQLDGKATSEQTGRVGLAFQHSRLQLQRRTVGEEIASWAGHGAGSAQVSRALDAVGLDRILAGRSIDELSGGQARRVVLAGLLANRSRVVVLDEPLAGLDPEGRRGIIDLLASLRRGGLTLIVISHDVDGMDAVCTRTVRLDSGRLVENSPTPVGGGTS